MSGDARWSPTPHGEARLRRTGRAHADRDAAAQPRRRRRHRRPPTWRRWPPTCPGRASRWSGSSSRGGSPGKKVAPRRRVLDDGAGRGRRDQLRVRTPLVVGGRSAGARSACRDRAASSAPPAAWRCPSRCTRPGRPEKSRLDELRGGPGARRWWSRASATRSGRPRSSRRDLDLTVVPGADHGFKVPKRGGAQPGGGAGDRRRGDAGVGGARGGRESSGAVTSLALARRHAAWRRSWHARHAAPATPCDPRRESSRVVGCR